MQVVRLSTFGTLRASDRYSYFLSIGNEPGVVSPRIAAPDGG
jgi:hypothetical protein